jgi:hypothetical protein
LPEPDEPWEPYEGLTVGKIVPIFTQVIYNMDNTFNRTGPDKQEKAITQDSTGYLGRFKQLIKKFLREEHT